MTHHMARLRDQIVYLEALERRYVDMRADDYLAAARCVREIIRHELHGLALQAFVGNSLPALQATAENVHFDTHRCFADLDGSGNAARAQRMADRLIGRLRRA